eukprot:scaffold114631_cov47-Attheya_sp.AAC.1
MLHVTTNHDGKFNRMLLFMSCLAYYSTNLTIASPKSVLFPLVCRKSRESSRDEKDNRKKSPPTTMRISTTVSF